MALFIKWVKLFTLVASLIFMGFMVTGQWQQIKSYDVAPDYPLLAMSIPVLLMAFLLGTIGWHKILLALGESHPLKTSIKIWTISSLIRYLPGGIWGYVSRAALCKEQGISLSISMVSLYLETLLLFLSSLVIGLPAAISITGLSIPLEYLLIAGLSAALLIHPRFFLLIKYLSGRFKKYIQHIKTPTTAGMILLYFYYLFFLTVYGIAFLLFTASLVPLPADSRLLTASAFPLAFCIGYILFIFPSGIGIRESMIYVLMLDIAGPAESLVIAIGSRIWTIFVEIIFLLAVYLYINSGNLSGLKKHFTVNR